MHLQKILSLSFFLLSFFFFAPLSTHAQSTVKLGIIGDSNSDEYRADDDRGGSYASVTLSWNEQLEKIKGFDLGEWGCRPEPRRCGYANNWARSGANATGYISAGQHTGLAAQVASGAVTHVLIQASENDFNTWNGTYAEVYNGTLSGTQLQQKINNILQSYRTAVTTVQSAGNPQIVISTLGDKAIDPSIVASFPDPAKRQRVANAVASINQGIKALAQEKDIGVFDVDQFTQTDLLTRLNTQNYTIRVGNRDIIMLSRSNNPLHLQLDDSVGHPGTVGSGLFANAIMKAFNSKYGNNWELFSDQRILETAGLAPPSSTATPVVTNTPQATATSTPVPATSTPATVTESTVCRADIDMDGVVDLTDYSILVTQFLQSPPTNPRADLTGDNQVNLIDYTMLVTNFFKVCDR